MTGPWRDPAEATTGLYPGFVVADNVVTGSILLGSSRLPIWCFLIDFPEWDAYGHDEPGAPHYGVSKEHLAEFWGHLAEQRGEFARLLPGEPGEWLHASIARTDRMPSYAGHRRRLPFLDLQQLGERVLADERRLDAGQLVRLQAALADPAVHGLARHAGQPCSLRDRPVVIGDSARHHGKSNRVHPCESTWWRARPQLTVDNRDAPCDNRDVPNREPAGSLAKADGFVKQGAST